MDLNNLDSYMNILREFFLNYGLKLVGAIIALIIGMWLVSTLTKMLARLMEARNVEASLRSFLRTTFNIMLKILLVIVIATMVGIPMTSFIAIMAAAGLAVGMALSGTLQNFAGGVIILLLRPYKVGDFIEAQGFMGTVKEIQIFHTIMNTVDNKLIIIPNGPLSNGSLTNFSAEATRRVDLTYGISYGNDVSKAKDVISSIIVQNDKIMDDPAPFIGLAQLADSSVNIVVRLWVKAEDYWAVHFYMNDNVYKIFPEKGLDFPFPQMDVHISKTE